MPIKKNLIFLILITLLSCITWVIVITNFDPQESKLKTILLFYITLSLVIIGVVSIVEFSIKFFLEKDKKNLFTHFKKSIFDAILVACFITLALNLFHYNLLMWWNCILLCALVIILKISLQNNQKNKKI